MNRANKPKLSWGAIQFLAISTSYVLNVITILTIAIILTSLLASFFLKANITIEVKGQVNSDVGLSEIWIPQGGIVYRIEKSLGERVNKGDLLVLLSFDRDTFEQLVQMKAMLEKSLSKIEANSDAYSSLNEALSVLRTERISDAQLLESINSLIYKWQKFKNEPSSSVKADLQYALRTTISRLRIMIENSTVRSAASGQIIGLNAKVGMKISSDYPVVTIEPDNSRLISQLWIPEKHRQSVKVAQEVIYKIDAYPYQKYGVLRGKVISFDSRNLLNGNTAFSVADGSIDLPDKLLDKSSAKEAVDLSHGMKLTASIVTERKTLFSILTGKIFGN